ncbi:MAG: hypothetical protein LKF71_05315 [Oscillospiraceae bacterium]|nr:hypothetical protein [Oscillospiraceae bacterium]
MTVPEGHVIRQFQIGNVQVKVCDDCCQDISPEKIKEILGRCGEIWAESEAQKAKQGKQLK